MVSGRTRLVLSASGVLVSGLLLLVVLGYAALVAYAAFTTGTGVVGVLFELAVPYLLLTAVLLVALVVSGIGLAWELLRRVPRLRSDRLATVLERVEREYSPVGPIGLSELARPPEPSAEERAESALDDLKRRYVEGEITEAEFERKVDRLVASESVDEARASRERRDAREKRSERRF